MDDEQRRTEDGMIYCTYTVHIYMASFDEINQIEQMNGMIYDNLLTYIQYHAKSLRDKFVWESA